MTAEQDRTDAKDDYPLICESCGRHLPCRHCDAAEIPDEWVEAFSAEHARHDHFTYDGGASAMSAVICQCGKRFEGDFKAFRQLHHCRRAALAAAYPLIRAEVEQEFARMISAAKSAEGRVVTAQRERDELAAAVLALADEWERRGHGPVPEHIADEGCQGCRIVAELRAVVGVEAAARVKAQALREHRLEWADWIEGHDQYVGSTPLTVEDVIRTLRSEHPPFGIAKNPDHDALDADTGSAT